MTPKFEKIYVQVQPDLYDKYRFVLFAFCDTCDEEIMNFVVNEPIDPKLLKCTRCE